MEKLTERAERLGFVEKYYLEGLDLLVRSGLFRILRELGQVESVPPSTPNYEAYQNALAHFSVGFNNALDFVQYFKKKLDAEAPKYKPIADFGGISKAVKDGNISEDEANELRAERQLGDT